MNKTKSLLFVVIIAFVSIFIYNSNKETDYEQKQREYAEYLSNHPYSKRGYLSKEDLKAMPKEDRPDLAFEQNFLRTMNPFTKTVPRDQFLKALDYTKEMQKTARKSANEIGLNWVSRGPNNVAGRTRALMFDPNDASDKKVFSGGVGGGIWVNNDITDANSSWVLLEPNMTNFAVTAMDFDPTNTTTMYVGTGEGFGNFDAINGGGIWKSTDGGVTWNNLPSSQTYEHVFDIIVRNESGIGVIYAAARDLEDSAVSGIIKSTDGGETWSLESSEAARDLELSPNNTIWAGTSDGKIISKNASASNFTVNYTSTVDNPRRVDVAVAQSNANVVYGIMAARIRNDEDTGFVTGLGEIVKTTNGGKSWAATAKNPEDKSDRTIPESDFTRGQAWYDLIIQISPANENHIYAGGINTFKSLNGGDTWTKITSWSDFYDSTVSYAHADQHNIIFRQNHPNELLVANDGGIQYAPDLTQVPPPLSENSYNEGFEIRNKNFNITQYYSAAIDPINPNGFLGGTQDNGTQHLTSPGLGSSVQVSGGDGGFSFIDQTAFNETDGVYQIISFTNNNYYLLDYTNLEDGEPNFIALVNQANRSNGTFINAADYDDVNNVLYSNDSDNKISIATLKPDLEDQGTNSFSGTIEVITLPELGNSEVTNIKVSPYNPEDRAVFFSTAAGRIVKWRKDKPAETIINFGVFSGSISSLEIGASDDELLLTYSNYGIKNVWYSLNGGTNWTDVEGNLPDMPVRWSLFNPSDRKQVILATEVGIWNTNDINASPVVWEPRSTNMGNVRVDMLQYRESDDLILAGTHGRGMFTASFSSNTASIEDVLTDKNTFTVYPTVSNGNFTVFAKSSLGNAKINIFDISGRQVYTSEIDFSKNEKQTISLNTSAGIYIVNLIDENGKKDSKKIVIE